MMNILARRQGTRVIVATFLIALILTMLPLPEWARIHRPDWVLLALIYWVLALPHRIGVGTGWTMGLITDVATGALLGQHALAYSLIAYLAVKLHQRIRLYPVWQQSFSVLVLLALGQLLSLWINGVIGRPTHSWLYWTPSLLGALLWPPVFGLLRGVRRHFRVV